MPKYKRLKSLASPATTAAYYCNDLASGANQEAWGQGGVHIKFLCNITDESSLQRTNRDSILNSDVLSDVKRIFLGQKQQEGGVHIKFPSSTGHAILQHAPKQYNRE